MAREADAPRSACQKRHAPAWQVLANAVRAPVAGSVVATEPAPWPRSTPVCLPAEMSNSTVTREANRRQDENERLRRRYYMVSTGSPQPLPSVSATTTQRAGAKTRRRGQRIAMFVYP